MTHASKTWDTTVRALDRTLRAGKRVGLHYYVHASLVGSLPDPVRKAVEDAAGRAHVVPWNILKLGVSPGPRTVSFLHYPGFWTEAEPALAHACSVSLDENRVSCRRYDLDRDAWILHRKELFLLHADPRMDEARARTAQLERRGAYADTRRIGRRSAWAEVLRALPNPPIEPSRCYSEKTSLRQVPALLKALAHRGDLASGSVNADIGGGAYALGTAFLADAGVQNLVYDCQLDRGHNSAVLRQIADGGAHSATVANVLNVIPSGAVRREVVALAVHAVRPGGSAWFAVYEGDRSGQGRATSKGWQENRLLDSYLAEVRAVAPGASIERVESVRAIRARV